MSAVTRPLRVGDLKISTSATRPSKVHVSRFVFGIHESARKQHFL